MADVKFHRGLSTEMSSLPLADGQLLFAIDTGNWFTDIRNSEGKLVRIGSNLAEVASILNNHLLVHAPSDAEANVIVGLTRNGVDLPINSERVVDIDVPSVEDLLVVSSTKPNHACMWCKVLREETK